MNADDLNWPQHSNRLRISQKKSNKHIMIDFIFYVSKIPNNDIYFLAFNMFFFLVLQFYNEFLSILLVKIMNLKTFAYKQDEQRRLLFGYSSM